MPNEEWGNHWFMALVRIGDLKRMQLVFGSDLGRYEIEQKLQKFKILFMVCNEHLSAGNYIYI